MFADRRRKFSRTHKSVALIVAGVVFVLIVQFGLFRILQTFSTDPLEDSRFQFVRYTMAAASSYLPFGSGMGTFVPVYAMFEKSPNVFVQYINHAHNDFAELTLESGVIGPTLVLVFAVWFALRSRTIWTVGPAGAGDFDRLLMRAATLVIVLLAAHSLVDYPLRTAAMTGVLAFACGLLFEPLNVGGPTLHRGRRDDEMAERAQQGAPVLTPAATSLVPTSSHVPLPAPQSRGHPVRWGEDVDWPEAWRKSNPDSSTRAVKPPASGKPATDGSDTE
jgi:hypothetical protein